MRRLLLLTLALSLFALTDILAAGHLRVEALSTGRAIGWNNSGYDAQNYTHFGAVDWGISHADPNVKIFHTNFRPHPVAQPWRWVGNRGNTRVYRVWNKGNARIHMPHLYVTGTNASDFRVRPGSGWKTYLDPGEWANFEVDFHPRSHGFGNKFAQIHIYANGASNIPVVWNGNRIMKINIVGNAIQPRIKVGHGSTMRPDGYNNPNDHYTTELTFNQNEANGVDYGRWRQKAVRVVNASPYPMRADLLINGRTDNRGHFAIHRIGSNSAIIQPGETVNFTVRFYGNRMGRHGAWISVKPNSCPWFNHDVAFYGTTLVPRVTVSGIRGNGNTRALVQHGQGSDWYDGTDFGTVGFGHQQNFVVRNENRRYAADGQTLITTGENLQRLYFNHSSYSRRLVTFAGHWAPDFRITRQLPNILDPHQQANLTIQYRPRHNLYVTGGHWCWAYIWMNNCPAPFVFQIRANNAYKGNPLEAEETDIEVTPVTDEEQYMQALADGGIEVDFGSELPTEATMNAVAEPVDMANYFTEIDFDAINNTLGADVQDLDLSTDEEAPVAEEETFATATEVEQMEIYPNPANAGFVNVRIPAQFQDKSLELKVVSLTGQAIKAVQLNDYQQEVRLDLNERGMFLIQLFVDGELSGTEKAIFE